MCVTVVVYVWECVCVCVYVCRVSLMCVPPLLVPGVEGGKSISSHSQYLSAKKTKPNIFSIIYNIIIIDFLFCNFVYKPFIMTFTRCFFFYYYV